MTGHGCVRWGRLAVTVGAVAVVVLLAGGSIGSAASRVEHLQLSSVRSLHGTPKLSSDLVSVSAAARSGGTVAANAVAQSHALALTEGRVQIEVVARNVAVALADIRRVGGAVDGASGGLIEAAVPPAQLAELAGSGAVDRVRPPVRPFVQASDEGLQTTGAGWFQAVHGETHYNGAGVKIGIIDVGFAGLRDSGLRDAGLPAGLPAQVEPVPVPGGGGATTAQHCDPGEKHGVAVAQIVHAMAPGAQLYLYCAGDEVDLRADEQDAAAKGVRIINHSVAWFNTGRGDGTTLAEPGAPGQPSVPTPESTVSDAASQGILWVNAAGNDASTHWRGQFIADPSFPDFNDFGGGDDGNMVTILPGHTGCAFLRWDSWPVTTNDFDLYLVDSATSAVVAKSVDDQTSAPGVPMESLCYTNPSPTHTSFALFINRFSAASSPTMDLWFEGDSPLQHSTAAGSIADPASSPDALAVGAVCWADGAVEPYSSQGPTIDGRTKPDLVAPDSTSGSVYGDYDGRGCGASGFAGTSAAAPHVAGLAALLLQAEPGLGLHALRNALIERSSRHGGREVQDNTMGGGEAFLWYPPAGEPATEQGRLVYSLGVANVAGIYTAQPDGSGAIPVDFETSNGVSWTADGKILREAVGDIELVDPADRTVRAATILTRTNQDRSPDAQRQSGTSIVFVRANDIWKMNADGSDQQLLQANGFAPSWSPDGLHIAYHSQDLVTGATDIQVMNADGTGSHALTTTGRESRPVWSPGGSQIAYMVDNTGIGVMKADGSGQHVLVSNAGLTAGTIAAWSPDAALLAYAAGNGATRRIQIVDLAGQSVSAIKLPDISFVGGLSWTSRPPIIPPQTTSATASFGGEMKVGQWLHANTLNWLGDPLPTADYTWLSCALTCTTVARGTSDYRLTQSEVHRNISLRIAATNDAGTVDVSTTTNAWVADAKPYASTSPLVTGTPTAGQTFSATPGTWVAGSTPAFEYRWRRCTVGAVPAGRSACNEIAGATSSTYQPGAADVGSTLQVVVTAFTNDHEESGVALSPPTRAIAAAPPAGGGGGGGGGAAPPNLQVVLEALSAPRVVGDVLSYRATLTNKTQASQSTTLTLDLPAQTTYVGAVVQRGPGCTATGHTVQCPLDFFPGGATSVVVASARVDQLGDLTARASVVSSPADSDPSDDTAGLTVHVGAPSVVSARGGNAGGRSAGSGARVGKALVGTARNDTLVGTAKADRIDGGRGNDRINGREGNDRLVGGPGKDTILGGAGNDVILARDGERDVVDCGAGKDSVTADRKDVVSRNCEIVHRR